MPPAAAPAPTAGPLEAELPLLLAGGGVGATKGVVVVEEEDGGPVVARGVVAWVSMPIMS